jgi:hypothetical protein
MKKSKQPQPSTELRFNFNEGKQRLINLMNESTSDIKSDMLKDLKLTLDEEREDILGEIEDVIDTIRSFERTSNIVIERIEKADNIASIIAAFEHSVFEEMEETILCTFFGLESVTINYDKVN